MEHEYSSIQANFTPDSASQFLKKTRELIRKSVLYKPDTMGYETEPHVTILFGLHDVHPPFCAMDIIETHPTFTITLGKVSIFKGFESSNPFDVVKAEIKSSDVYALNTALADSCEHTSDFPEFTPHATMAFVREDSCDELEGAKSVFGISFLVKTLTYSSSNGTKRLLFLGQK